MQYPLQPRMTQPSTARHLDMARLPQSQMWHQGMSYTQPAPAMKGINQGVTSLPYPKSHPPMVLLSTERNENGTRLPQGQIWHLGMNHTQPSPTTQNFAEQASSTAQQTTIPIYNISLASTPSRSIAVANPGLTEKRPQMSVNNVFNVMSEPSAKRTKHESTTLYKPDGIIVPNSDVTMLSEYKLYMHIV